LTIWPRAIQVRQNRLTSYVLHRLLCLNRVCGRTDHATEFPGGVRFNEENYGPRGGLPGTGGPILRRNTGLLLELKEWTNG